MALSSPCFWGLLSLTEVHFCPFKVIDEELNVSLLLSKIGYLMALGKLLERFLEAS